MGTFITCMGECLIDFLPLEKEGRVTDFRMYPAGSLLNVAVGVVRLGQSAALACKIADDYFGRYLQAYMQDEGVDTRYITTVNGFSALAFVTSEMGQPTFNFYGDGTADTLLTFDEVPQALFTETKILHIGSISLLRGTTPTAILKTFERLKGHVLLSLDPNIRPDLVRDEPQYRSLLQRLIACTDILKLSDADLAWLMPAQSLEQAMDELLAQGPALVIVTRGENGALAIRDTTKLLQVPAFAVDVADAVGAGDTFCAGVLTQFVESSITSRAAILGMTDEHLQRILRFAAATAALNCTREGANPPFHAEVEGFLASHSA